MSGYLTRIAERAVNAAPIVHANASLPFFGSAEALPMEEAFAAEADAGPTRRMPATRAADVLAPPADAESRAPVPRKPVTTPVGPPSVAPSDSFGRAPAEDPSREHVTTPAHSRGQRRRWRGSSPRRARCAIGATELSRRSISTSAASRLPRCRKPYRPARRRQVERSRCPWTSTCRGVRGETNEQCARDRRRHRGDP